MAKEAVFTMKLEAELRDRFMAEAASEDRPASQVMRALMRDYVELRQRARAHDDYLRQKVEVARAQKHAGLHLSHDEVEAEAASRREALLRTLGS
jgi:predicted transcriptional regulator